MIYDFTAFANFADKAESNPRLCELADRYDTDPHSLTDEELTEMDDLYGEAYGEEDYPEDDFYEDWDDLEMGFDPYMGSYSYDC